MWRERFENIQLTELIQTQIFCHWIIQINIEWRRPTSHLIGAELGWKLKDCLRASTESRIFQCFSLVCVCEIWILNQLWRKNTQPSALHVHPWLVTQHYGSHNPKICYCTQCCGGPSVDVIEFGGLRKKAILKIIGHSWSVFAHDRKYLRISNIGLYLIRTLRAADLLLNSNNIR